MKPARGDNLYGAHRDLDREFRATLATVQCPDHHDSPWLVRYGVTMYQSEIEGCCWKRRCLESVR